MQDIMLLVGEVQGKILVEALKRYSDQMEAEGHTEEVELADELRLSILSKRRQRRR